MKTVFFDIDTQIDFVYRRRTCMYQAPKTSCRNRQLNRKAPIVISTMDAILKTIPSFRSIASLRRRNGWPAKGRCDADRKTRPADNNRKTNARLFQQSEIVAAAGRAECRSVLVYGVVTEICVRLAIFGLLKMAASGTGDRTL